MTHLCVPYIRGLNEKLERVCTPLRVREVFKLMRRLKQTLMHIKTHIPEEKRRGVAYEVLCNGCCKTYIGETKRNPKVRISEHKQAEESNLMNGIAVHAHESHYGIDWGGVTVKRTVTNSNGRK